MARGRVVIRNLIGLTLLLVSHVSPLAAQTTAVKSGELQEHDRIRVWAPALSKEPVIGRVVKADTNELVLQWENGSRTLGWEQVERLDRYAGRYRAGPAILGAFAGGIAAYFGYKSYLDATTENDEWNTLSSFHAVPYGALAGAAIGAAVGFPKWESIQVNFAVGAGAWGGARIGLQRPL